MTPTYSVTRLMPRGHRTGPEEGEEKPLQTSVAADSMKAISTSAVVERALPPTCMACQTRGPVDEFPVISYRMVRGRKPGRTSASKSCPVFCTQQLAPDWLA